MGGPPHWPCLAVVAADVQCFRPRGCCCCCRRRRQTSHTNIKTNICFLWVLLCHVVYMSLHLYFWSRLCFLRRFVIVVCYDSVDLSSHGTPKRINSFKIINSNLNR